MMNIITNCTDGRDADGRDYFFDEIELDGRDGRYTTVSVPFTKAVPMEEVDMVETLPGFDGKCPMIKEPKI